MRADTAAILSIIGRDSNLIGQSPPAAAPGGVPAIEREFRQLKQGPVINYVVSIVAPEVSFPPPATAAPQKRLDLQQVSGGTLAPNGFDYLLK